MRYLAALGFIATIAAANYATTHLGGPDHLTNVGLGLTATAGTWFAGLAFVLRDSVQDTAGRRWVFALIAAGAALSWVLADTRIALASAAAFAVSELVDYAVYTPLRSRGYIRAAAASNTAGAVVDTLVFLSIAGIPLWPASLGQLWVKGLVTVGVLVGVAGVRRVRRHTVRATGEQRRAGTLTIAPVRCTSVGCGWNHDPVLTSTTREAERRMTRLHNATR